MTNIAATKNMGIHNGSRRVTDSMISLEMNDTEMNKMKMGGPGECGGAELSDDDRNMKDITGGYHRPQGQQKMGEN